jgi:hypothetical protein
VEPAWNVFTACLDGPYPTPCAQLRESANRLRLTAPLYDTPAAELQAAAAALTLSRAGQPQPKREILQIRSSKRQ